ncbi:LPS-assembly lipoprotein [Marinobacter persicus]|uniref:LPS-assembly lipoprotein LptE n=1 Tax=Marinobacter persicus TaxID=930118 RepID=A0A1I3PPI7_9GAMM|nr:LPS assembly lipoprotein LptE [Marinobacter persicus]GHD53640.1 LPS-assembly lipoprotein LptE [Marinobacter persicus]SFJ23478.1 LPS-assembly lipoprotein [Marinobacter persicus]
MKLCPALKASFPKALVLTAATVLAGCGFQLRGTSPVPAALQPLAVDCPESLPGDFCNSVRDQLELGGVKLVDENRADYILRLRDYQQDRRASAITSDASAAEYVLRHTVSVELFTADDVPLIAKTDLNASESYRYDENNVLAKQREEDELRQQLGDRLAQQVIFRLAPMTQQRIDAAITEYHDSQEDDGGS